MMDRKEIEGTLKTFEVLGGKNTFEERCIKTIVNLCTHALEQEDRLIQETTYTHPISKQTWSVFFPVESIISGLGRKVRELEEILSDMVDEDNCYFDHHGYCQAHGWFSEEKCPHERAKQALKGWGEDIQCPVCGYYCLGKGGVGCIDKPSMVE